MYEPDYSILNTPSQNFCGTIYCGLLEIQTYIKLSQVPITTAPREKGKEILSFGMFVECLLYRLDVCYIGRMFVI